MYVYKYAPYIYIYIHTHLLLSSQTTTALTSLPPSPQKVGIIGFTRAVASYFRALDGIRVNAVCPGAMRTAIIPDWGSMGDDCFTPLDLVADLVLRLGPHVHLHGDQDDDLVDSRGVRVPADSAYGLAVVVNGQKFYVQEEPAYCDDVMARTMEATKPENQSGANQGAAKQEGDEA